ncbi:Sensor histidine kinase RcsC [Achromobacter anxifer]|uniref:hybrid sensor histidine kinase/response regulator n=1 Tax=Achromobacter anxifer TaxID=1287737 RepID=UPI00155CBF86|nr:hybrid sensor histidine kinase/response regulator [Achromobacter anxifer]CAB5513178.1 Sensor histidine kinase RcsC [Achromobacter anxifer]
MPLKKNPCRLRRLSAAFLRFLPLALFCAAALYCAGQQVLRQQADLLQLDFSTLARHLDRQETMPAGLERPLHDQFWLVGIEGDVLLGDDALPAMERLGFRYAADGLILKTTDSTGSWTGYYKLKYGSLLRANAWLSACALLLLSAGLCACTQFWLWHRRHVAEPGNAARRALAECEALGRTLFTTVPCALCGLSRANGRLVFANALALQWLGAGKGQTLPDTQDAKQLLRLARLAQEPGHMATFNTPDGRSLAVAYAPTRYRGQDIVFCAFADISARAEMDRLLGSAKAQADKVYQSGAGILATITQEIRTPLYGMLGTLEVLGMTPLNEEQRQQVERIQSASAKLRQFLGSLLDIARMEAGQFALETSAFDPRKLMESAVAQHAALAERKGLLIYGCLDTSVPDCVSGDAGRIRQILGNLLNNAIEFTESGHVVARMRAQGLPDGKVRLDLQVSDSGIGIDAAGQASLFAAFQQSGAGSRAAHGARLGLYLCDRLAALMGSRIRIVSEPGLGSSFSLSLLLNQADAPPAPVPQLQGLRVLVRSARKEASENISQWLRLWGAQSRTVPPGSVAHGDETCVLVDLALIRNTEPAPWKGPHILAGTARGNGALVDRHSTRQIGYAIQQLMSGAAGALPPDPGPLNLRVLVAEDNPINQATLRDQLKRLGCRPVLASNGAEGLALWKIQPFDLVMTNIGMPGMDGYEFAGALRALGAEIPVVGLLANPTKAEKQRCMAAGMDAWLAKPISLRALRQQLQAYAAARTATESIPAAVQRTTAGPPLPGAPAIPAKYRAVFLETMERDIARLEASRNSGDGADVRAALHRIRGGLAAVHMTHLSRQAEDLETQLRKGGLDGAMPARLAAFVTQLRDKMTEISGETQG